MRRVVSRLLGGLLDPTVALAYGKPGYAARRMGFAPEDLAVRLDGKVCLVTGANAGIGFATARALALRGGEVWLLCRNAQRAQVAQQELREEAGHEKLHVALVDLSDFSSIRRFARDFEREKVDVLVHNAAILPEAREETQAGLEKTLATNLLGPFLLTSLLLERLRKAGDARVIHVSSGGMYTQRLDLGKLLHPPAPFDGVVQYARTKRALVLLNELWAAREPTIAFYSMHPGWADTGGVQDALPRFWRLTRPILRNTEEAADTAIWLAIAPHIDGASGTFWFDRQARTTYLLPGTREEPDERARLWSWCEHWSGLTREGAETATGSASGATIEELV